MAGYYIYSEDLSLQMTLKRRWTAICRSCCGFKREL